MSTARLDSELKNLQKRGVTLPQNPARAALEANSMHNLAKDRGGLREVISKYSVGPSVSDTNSTEVGRINRENDAMMRAMGSKRSNMQRVGSAVGGDVYAAIPRFYDPMEYWDLSGLPWNMADEGHRHKLHKWLRLYYATHYLVPILVDIFTRFPLVGMNLECKDPALVKFYEEHFFNDLNYDDFFVRMGREHWVVGEAFPLASFDDNLGVWEREELLNPQDIVIENFQLLDSKQLKVKPPDYLKRLVQTKTPPKQFRQLELSFPDLIPYLRRGEPFPVSNVLLKHVSNRLNDWDDHGTPILLRGLRTLLHEEKLMASQDAIAERLYSPLILAKLGIQDLGDNQGPWIPGPEEIDSVRDDFDLALSSDFRLMVHHFGLDVTSVFGREQMPRLGDDFDRIERRLMQVFGVNPSLLSAGASSQPYASSALQAEFLNQILRTFQKTLKDHYRSRALIVAEAQGHYDFEKKGGTRVPIYEEVIVLDPETGETVLDEFGDPKTERRHKLLVPDMDFATLDLRDEATERQFLQTLRGMGVPISNDKLMVGVDFDIEDEVEQYNKDLMHQTITQQRAKLSTYKALTAEGLPIPPDLKAEVETVLGDGTQPPTPGGAPPGGPGKLPAGPGGPGGGPPGPGGGGPGEGIVMPNAPGGLGLGPGGAGGTPPGGGPPARSPITGPAGTVPEVSNERRPGLTYNTKVASFEEATHAECPECGWTGEAREADEASGCPKCGKADHGEVEWHHVTESSDSTIDPVSDTLSDDAEPELSLEDNQELINGETADEYILERSASVTGIRKKKKYSFIDPDADPIEEDSDTETHE